MKKLFQLLAAALLCIGLSGCNATISDNTGAEDEDTSSSSDYKLYISAGDLDASYENASQILLNGEDVYISEAGTYLLTGSTTGSVIIEVSKDEEVRLVLDNATIAADDFAAIYIIEADKVTITLADGTMNYLSDASSYTQIDDNDVDAVVYSKADLVFNGTGSLNVEANYENGIVSKDDLIFAGGNYTVNADSGQGIRGKDCIRITESSFTIRSFKDAIHSDNDEDEGRGYVYIENGTFDIESSADGIYGYNLVMIEDGIFDISTSGNADSLKGIKSDASIIIDGGQFTLDTEDDALHCDGSITINDGELTLSSGDDGVHADTELIINGGIISILESYEGLEGQYITINEGTISIVSSDDGMNAAEKSAQSSSDFDFGKRKDSGNTETIPQKPDTNNEEAMPMSFVSSDSTQAMGFSGASTDAVLTINGGDIYVNAGGDGLDSNGTIVINGGNIAVDGPSSSANAALDYETSGTITGGELIMIGSSGMAEKFSSSSTQVNLLYNFSGSCSAGSQINIYDADGELVLSMTSAKSFNSILISSSSFAQGDTITVEINGESTTYTLDSVCNSTSSGSGFSGGGGMSRPEDMSGGGFDPSDMGADVPELPSNDDSDPSEMGGDAPSMPAGGMDGGKGGHGGQGGRMQ